MQEALESLVVSSLRRMDDRASLRIEYDAVSAVEDRLHELTLVGDSQADIAVTDPATATLSLIVFEDADLTMRLSGILNLNVDSSGRALVLDIQRKVDAIVRRRVRILREEHVAREGGDDLVTRGGIWSLQKALVSSVTNGDSSSINR